MSDEVTGAGNRAGTELSVSTAELLGLEGRPSKVSGKLDLRLTEHTYLPKADSPRRDWVATVALPAFKSYSRRHGPEAVRRFCSIGTGSGVDCLAAVETFDPELVVVTDLHEDVVEQAVTNIKANIAEGVAPRVQGVAGDLATPLLGGGHEFDLIYENLPNIPLPEDIDLLGAQTSSSFVDSSALKDIPDSVRENLLELHYAFLAQARGLLSREGRVLCSIGARIPLADILEMVQQAGFQPQIIAYTWKIQTEAEEVVSGYADQERRGAGPFHFYPVGALEEAFASTAADEAAGRAQEIERELETSAIDVEAAMRLTNEGKPVGHTVAVIEATPGRPE